MLDVDRFANDFFFSKVAPKELQSPHRKQILLELYISSCTWTNLRYCFLGTNKGTIHKTLTDLLNKELIIRDVELVDENRIITYSITEKGQKLIENFYTKTIPQGLGIEEIRSDLQQKSVKYPSKPKFKKVLPAKKIIEKEISDEDYQVTLEKLKKHDKQLYEEQVAQDKKIDDAINQLKSKKTQKETEIDKLIQILLNNGFMDKSKLDQLHTLPTAEQNIHLSLLYKKHVQAIEAKN